MNNKASLVPESSAGWAIGLVALSERGKVEAEGFLTCSEGDCPDQRWLALFRTQQEARAYVASKLHAPAPEGNQWAYTEFTASELLGFLRDYPDLEGVLFNPGSDETHFVASAVLIGVLERHLGEPEGDAA
jgi:hypothetical protein